MCISHLLRCNITNTRLTFLRCNLLKYTSHHLIYGISKIAFGKLTKLGNTTIFLSASSKLMGLFLKYTSVMFSRSRFYDLYYYFFYYLIIISVLAFKTSIRKTLRKIYVIRCDKNTCLTLYSNYWVYAKYLFRKVGRNWRNVGHCVKY